MKIVYECENMLTILHGLPIKLLPEICWNTELHQDFNINSQTWVMISQT